MGAESLYGFIKQVIFTVTDKLCSHTGQKRWLGLPLCQMHVYFACLHLKKTFDGKRLMIGSGNILR